MRTKQPIGKGKCVCTLRVPHPSPWVLSLNCLEMKGDWSTWYNTGLNSGLNDPVKKFSGKTGWRSWSGQRRACFKCLVTMTIHRSHSEHVGSVSTLVCRVLERSCVQSFQRKTQMMCKKRHLSPRKTLLRCAFKSWENSPFDWEALRSHALQDGELGS